MKKDFLLRNALKANGGFSILSALLAILFGESVLAVNEMANSNGMLFGIQLIVFAAFVLFNAFRNSVSKVMIIIIIVLDVLYVLGAVNNLFTLSAELSVGGMALIMISTLAIASFAFFQSLGLKRVW